MKIPFETIERACRITLNEELDEVSARLWAIDKQKIIMLEEELMATREDRDRLAFGQQMLFGGQFRQGAGYQPLPNGNNTKNPPREI